MFVLAPVHVGCACLGLGEQQSITAPEVTQFAAKSRHGPDHGDKDEAMTPWLQGLQCSAPRDVAIACQRHRETVAVKGFRWEK